MIVEAGYTTNGIGGRAGGHVTHLTLTLVQIIYSISSENGFWKVKELVLIQIHSLDLERNRYMTERTWPFSFTTCNESNTSVVYMLVRKKVLWETLVHTHKFHVVVCINRNTQVK